MKITVEPPKSTYNLMKASSLSLPHLALAVNADVNGVIIAARSIDYFGFVTVIKSFTSWHTV